jgi:hypothetical protein
MPFADTAPITTFTGKHGFAQHTDKVAFPLKELSPNSSELIKSLSSGIPIVVMLEQTDGGAGRFPVYGLYGGLHGSPEMTYELNDERCWEVILESFNTGYPQRFLFDTDEAGTLALFNLLTGYEYISGLTIGSGVSVAKVVYLHVDADETAYIVLPDGQILTSTSGEISTTWEGVAGAIILIVPKANTEILLNNGIVTADFIGLLSTNYAVEIGVTGSSSITGIDAPQATEIAAGSSGVTLANANIILLNADANGEEDGAIDLGLPAEGWVYGDLSSAAEAAYLSLIAKGWTIVIDGAPS